MNRTLHMALCLLPGMGLAQDADFLGTWCPQADGPLMHFEESGLGFGDHTMCDWKEGPHFDNGGFEGLLTCQNVYVTGQNTDGSFATVITDQRRGVGIEARLVRTDRFGGRYLGVTFDGVDMPSEYGPCG